jgi:hypothetical protein
MNFPIVRSTLRYLQIRKKTFFTGREPGPKKRPKCAKSRDASKFNNKVGKLVGQLQPKKSD